MNFQFTHPWWLLALPFALAWIIYLSVKSYVFLSPWRRWTAGILRGVIVTAIILGLAGIQRKVPQEGMNVYFLLDRSDSIPSVLQEQAREWVITTSKEKRDVDKGGLVVFGTEAAIEISPAPMVDIPKFQAVVESARTDIAGAVRLGTAAFPETGQKRLVLISDGNENSGEVFDAVLAAKPLGVTIDVLPLGVARRNDVSLQKVGLPNEMKKGQTFDMKIFVNSDTDQEATLRIFQNEQYLGEQTVQLTAGKNLYTVEQTLPNPGFFKYEVEVEVEGDFMPRNNKATAFANVRGDPRVLVVSSDPEEDASLIQVLRDSQLEVIAGNLGVLPESLAEMQSYDSIFLCNINAGDMSDDYMKLLESAVRDRGVGLVCVGGDQAYTDGAYKGTPLEDLLPVSMELDSKKVIPKGALALVMHGMEFNNGNQIARDIAFGALQALGPRDELGVLLWDGTEKWLFELQEVGDKRRMGSLIAGMNQGDLPSFQGLMTLGYESLKKSTANLKHMIIFSDGDPDPPTTQLMADMRAANITVSTVLIAGHAGPDRMIKIAEDGNGRFYHVTNPGQLPQIFIKETSVILKSAIIEKPFIPQVVSGTELVRGIGSAVPPLQGYVATSPKPRAELPMVTDKADPLLAHWRYGLGRVAAFTSDAKPKWARDWLSWDRYQQFWSQIGKWSLRRLDNADLTTEVAVENGEGIVTVEALDAQGEYRNFLTLQSVVVSPTGERETVTLEQKGPGRYEARFPTKEVGAYMLNLLEMQDGEPVGSKAIGTSVDYSPEYNDTTPNLNRLRRIAELSGGRVLDQSLATDNPYLHDRQKTFQPRDLWPLLLQMAIILFTLDVGIRRIQLDKQDWLKATRSIRRFLFFWDSKKDGEGKEESFAGLLASREKAREKTKRPEARKDLFKPTSTPAPVNRPSGSASSPSAPATPKPAEKKEPEKQEGGEQSAAERLLAAKRRARKKKF